jgi:protein-disulfide isomerase
MSEEKKMEDKVEEKVADDKKEEAIVTTDKKKNDKCTSGCCDLVANKNIFVWIIIAVLVIGGIVIYQMKQGEDMSERPVSEDVAQQVKDKTIALIEEQQLVPAEITVEVGEVTEESGLYKVMITVQDQEVTSYMSKDMTKFIPQLIDLKEIEEAEAAANTEETTSLPADEAISVAAESLGVDMEAFSSCVAEDRYAQKVDESVKEGMAAGVMGTPHNVLIANGKQYELSGAVPYETISAALDALLTGGTPEEAQEAEKLIQAVSADDHMRGNANAQVAFVEYSDVECPFCERHHDVVEQLVEEYGSTVNFVFRSMPLDQLHPDARSKHEAAECVAEIGGEDMFWTYLDLMFKS